MISLVTISSWHRLQVDVVPYQVSTSSHFQANRIATQCSSSSIFIWPLFKFELSSSIVQGLKNLAYVSGKRPVTLPTRTQQYPSWHNVPLLFFYFLTFQKGMSGWVTLWTRVIVHTTIRVGQGHVANHLSSTVSTGHLLEINHLARGNALCIPYFYFVQF